MELISVPKKLNNGRAELILVPNDVELNVELNNDRVELIK